MVREQLMKRGISAPALLEAFNTLARELFVPERHSKDSYSDNPLPIGEAQTISQPYMTALMTELLSPETAERILEIGTGSGYQAAILAKIGAKVYTVERKSLLLKRAREVHKSLGLAHIYYKFGDGSLGWEEEAPFDGIIVTAAAPEVPQELLRQLKPGGKILIPVGDRSRQELLLVKKNLKGKTEVRRHGVCRFVPLIGEYGFSPDSLD